MQRYFSPSLYDKLFPVRQGEDHLIRKFSFEEVKNAVARDLEALLNTRMMFNIDSLEDFPNCQRSILNYGICDFSNKSLSNFADCQEVCESVKLAIACHEPRLRAIKVDLVDNPNPHSVATLCFAISATLFLNGVSEHVLFDATLQPSTLLYEVR